MHQFFDKLSVDVVHVHDIRFFSDLQSTLLNISIFFLKMWSGLSNLRIIEASYFSSLPEYYFYSVSFEFNNVLLENIFLHKMSPTGVTIDTYRYLFICERNGILFICHLRDDCRFHTTRLGNLIKLLPMLAKTVVLANVA